MYAQIEKSKESKSRAGANPVGQKKNNNQSFHFADERHTFQIKKDRQGVTYDNSNKKQSVIPLASKKDYLSSDVLDRGASVAQKYDKTDFNKIKNLVDSYSANAFLIENVGNAGLFNERLSSLTGYKMLSDEEKEMVKAQVEMKIKHDHKLAAVKPEDNNDIKKNFNALKSCVITALMYAEGGSVLGTSSVEGLHYILYTQFPKWRQYSDDNVLAQMYKSFGYSMATVGGQARHTLVTSQNREKGMTASTGDVGHMVGFKKDKDKYMFRDNDHGEAEMSAHATKNQQVNKIWWK